MLISHLNHLMLKELNLGWVRLKNLLLSRLLHQRGVGRLMILKIWNRRFVYIWRMTLILRHVIRETVPVILSSEGGIWALISFKSTILRFINWKLHHVLLRIGVLSHVDSGIFMSSHLIRISKVWQLIREVRSPLLWRVVVIQQVLRRYDSALMETWVLLSDHVYYWFRLLLDQLLEFVIEIILERQQTLWPR